MLLPVSLRVPWWASVVLAGALGCAGTTGASGRDGGADVSVDRPHDPAPDAPRDEGTAADVPLDGAIDAPRSARCDELTGHGPGDGMGVAAATGIGVARLPDTSCSVLRGGLYIVRRITLQARTPLWFRLRSVRSVGVRRLCDDVATEVACLRPNEEIFRDLTLEAGTYDLIVEPDEWLFPHSFQMNAPLVTANGACATPEALRVGTPFGTTAWFSRASTARPGCVDAWRALYYRATVPPGQRLQVAVIPDVYPARNRVTARLLSDCDVASCLDAVDAPAGIPAYAAWTNPSSTAREVIVAVAPGPEEPTSPPSSIRSFLHSGPLGDRCDDAPSLAVDREERIDTVGATVISPACDASGPIGASRFRRIRVPPRQELLVQALHEAGSGLRPALRAYDGCGTLNCLGERVAVGPDSDWLRVVNDSDAPRDVVVAVGASGTGVPRGAGLFLLRAALHPLDAGTRCDAPAEVPVDQPTLVSSLRSSLRAPRCAPWEEGGRAIVVRVNIPPRRVVSWHGSGPYLSTTEARVTPMRGCPIACEQLDGGASEVANPGADPMPVRFLVSARSTDGSVLGAIRFQTRAIPSVAPCAEAPRIALGRSRIEAPSAPDAIAPCGYADAPEGARVAWRRVEVPANHVLRAASLSGVVTLALTDRCDATFCATGALIEQHRGSPHMFGAWLANRARSPRDILLANVLTASEPQREVFLETRPIAANATCETAIRLEPDRTYDDLDAAGGDESVAVAPREFSHVSGPAPSVFYRVTVPAGRELVAVATPPAAHRGAWYLRPVLLDGCRGAPLTAGVSMSWRNTSPSAREVILAVGAPPATDTRFRLALSLRTPADATSCEGAEAAADGTTLRDVVLPGRTGYRSLPNDPRRYLRVELAPFQTVAFESTRPLDVEVRRACGTDSWEFLERRVSHLHNGSARPEVWHVGLRLSEAPPAETTVRVHITPSAYTITAASGACDVLPGPPQLTDEGVTPVRPLPFPFRWFGEPVVAWSADFHGFLQLHPSADVAPRAAPFRYADFDDLSNYERLPRRILAPLPGRLEILGASSGVRAAVIDAPRRHLTVEWRRVSLNGYLASPFTAQAWLFENGTVELRYCEVPANWGRPVRAPALLTDAANLRVVGVPGDLPATAGSVFRFTPR